MDFTAYLHPINTGNSNSYNVTNSHKNIINVNKVIAEETQNLYGGSRLSPVVMTPFISLY